MHSSTLSERLREARMGAGLTRAELARRLKVDRGTVMRAEDGKNEPRPSTLAAWARACGVSADSLLGIDTETTVTTDPDDASPARGDVTKNPAGAAA